MKREFTRSRDELDAMAVDRAAKIVRDIFVVLQKSGHAQYVSLDGAAGAAGLLAVAHAAYKEALVEVEMEHQVRDSAAWMDADMAVPSPVSAPRAYVSPIPLMLDPTARPARLRSVPHAAPPSEYVHDDGTPCECDPGCNCHPSTRNEDPIVTGERGSWHLDTCPVSPKNRGKEQP